MAVLRTTGSGRLNKYTSSMLGVITDSMSSGSKLTFTTSGKTATYAIKKTPANKQALDDYVKLAASAATESKAKAITLETTTGARVPIGNLEKKHVKPDAFNRGDVSEGLLAAAIAARFVNKNKVITKQDAINILKELRPQGGTKINQTFMSENENPVVKDQVRIVISLAEINMKALLNPANYGGLSDLINASVKYANGQYITKWSKLLYENNVHNEIDVISDGLLDQSGTKVDLRVKVDGKLTDVNVSLKAGDVKQFGQVSGSKLENMAALFNPLGLKVETQASKFNEFLNKKDTVGATSHIYNYVAKTLATEASNNKNAFLKSLSSFIKFHATRDEENVTLVQLNRNEAKIYDFNNVQKMLSVVEPTVFIKNGYSDVAKAQVPTIVIADKSRTGKNELLTIRMKIDTRPDGFYHRNYIEKGALLGDLIAEYA
jgi:hypothetical protein